jgi:hypothetical protein
MPEREHLLIRGRLTRTDEFIPRRCSSTMHVRQWPERDQRDHGDVVAETVSSDGEVLRTEAPSVVREEVCAPGEPTWRVRVYVPLDEDAAEVRLRRGGRVLWSARIPDRPDVRMRLTSPPVRGRSAEQQRPRRRPRGDDDSTPGYPGGDPAVVEIEVSEPADAALAFLTIVHRWGERRFHTVYIGPVQRRVAISADRLPGGNECELFVIYSNGLRAATARSETFAVEPIGPVLTIVRPQRTTVLTEGVPVALEGVIVDPENPSAATRGDTAIWSVDGEVVGAGALTSVDGLSAGDHVVELAYRSRDAATDEMARVSVRIQVSRPQSAPAEAWEPIDRYRDF